MSAEISSNQRLSEIRQTRSITPTLIAQKSAKRNRDVVGDFTMKSKAVFDGVAALCFYELIAQESMQ